MPAGRTGHSPMFQALQGNQFGFSMAAYATHDVHLAVAKATLVIPASVQMFSTPTTFL